MKATALLLLTALLTTSVLAGCLASTDGPQEALSCEEKHDIPEGHGYVIILIDQPKNRREAGLVSLWATPGLVAWKGYNNSTNDFVGASVAKRLDWTVQTQVWYSEPVPTGNYSFIRIQVPDPIIAKYPDGREPDIAVRGEALTYQMANPQIPWHVPEGECLHMAFSSEVVRGISHDFEIQGALRDPPRR